MREPLLVDQRIYRDLHKLESEIYRWDVVFKKISTGRFHGTVGMVDLGTVQLLDVRFSGTLFQYGYAPEGYVTLVLPALDCQPFWWHFRHISPTCLLSFPGSRLVNAVSGDGFHIYVLSMKEDLFERLSSQLGIPQVLNQVRGKEKVLSLEKHQIYPLNSLLQALFLEVQAREDSFNSSTIRKTLEHKVPEMFLKLLLQEKKNEIPISRERDRSMFSAIDYILRQDLKYLSVNQIERAIKVKRRSLEYAFKEYFQVGPKYFIKALRLNQFRHALIVGGESVSKTASDHHFTHLGQLSQDYKQLFDELPSATLKNAMKKA